MDLSSFVNDALCRVTSFRGAFTPDECDAIVRSTSRDPGDPGLVAGYENVTLRRSTVRWVNHEPANQWVIERLSKLVAKVNRDLRFDMKCFEPIQVAEYVVSDHFDWHIDLGLGPASLRKLSITVQLSNPSDYDGGDLEVLGMSTVQQPRERGTAIVFPAFLPHRVCPITRGNRFSLVAWVSGPAFR